MVSSFGQSNGEDDAFHLDAFVSIGYLKNETHSYQVSIYLVLLSYQYNIVKATTTTISSLILTQP